MSGNSNNTNFPLSTWVTHIAPSPTLEVDAKIKALKAEGVNDICGFGTGEPDFDTPHFIKEACIQSLNKGQTKYLPAAGLMALREAVAEKAQSFNKIKHTSPAQVIISPGGKFACYATILATCSPGEEVIIPAPYWVSYPEMVKLVGAVPKIIKTDEQSNFKITPKQLSESITAKTRLFILNSPNNPSGIVYTRLELEALMDVALKYNLYVLSDEIYEHLLYDGAVHHSPASFGSEAARHTITISGFSKTFSMTGWRLGTIVAPLAIAQAIANYQSQTSSNATSFAQYGALAAIRNEEEAQKSIEKMLQVFDRRRINLIDGLNAIQGISCLRGQAAFYLFPNISSFGLTSTEFASQLLDEQKVAVVPGVAFGEDFHLRLSYATSDDILERGLERLKAFCQKFSIQTLGR